MSLKFANNNSLSAIDIKPSGLSRGALTLLSTQTASSSATIDFTSGIDSTYKEYLFLFNNMHPETDGTALTFQGSTNGGSSYGVTITSTWFSARHTEDGGTSSLSYNTGKDLAQSTNFQQIPFSGNANDESTSWSISTLISKKPLSR